MIESVQSDNRRAVLIQDIFAMYGVHFTTETMRILEDGIRNLSATCRMLLNLVSTWDTDFHADMTKSSLATECRWRQPTHRPACGVA